MFIKYKKQVIHNSISSLMATTIALYILLTLTLSSTIHARESHFFNKYSTNIPNDSQPSNTNNNQQQQQQPFNTNNQQQPLNTNNQQQPLNPNNQQQQQPEFIPQSQDSDSYGLYGHESGQLPPSATTTTTTNNNLPHYLPENYNPVAYTTPIHSNTQQHIPNYDQSINPQTNHYNNENQMYNSEKQGFDDASFMETEEDGGDMYNSEKHVGNERYNQGYNEMYKYNSQRYGTSNNGNMYNPEKQGMSDTRFLENGKYFYDLNMENLNSNENMNSRRFGSRNEYNTQGYYGNNQNSYDARNEYNTQGYYGNNNQNSYDARNEYNTQGYYGNNQNSYDRYHFNGGNQNQQYRFNP